MYSRLFISGSVALSPCTTTISDLVRVLLSTPVPALDEGEMSKEICCVSLRGHHWHEGEGILSYTRLCNCFFITGPTTGDNRPERCRTVIHGTPVDCYHLGAARYFHSLARKLMPNNGCQRVELSAKCRRRLSCYLETKLSCCEEAARPLRLISVAV